MYTNGDGYRCDMKPRDVMASYDPSTEEDGVWLATCFGPITSHETVLFRSKREAYEWCVNDMSDGVTVDEMCPDCWKDTGGSGTEWEVRRLDGLKFAD